MAKIVTAAILVRQGRALAARRAPGQAHEGKWEFPGGKLETGETEEMCLEREMREEFGIRGKTGPHFADSLYAYEKGEILLRAYLFDWQQGEMIPTVHDKLLWAGAGQIETLDFTPADVPIAARVRKYLEDTNDG